MDDILTDWYMDRPEYETLKLRIKRLEKAKKRAPYNSRRGHYLHVLELLGRMTRSKYVYHWAVTYGRRDDAITWHTSFHSWHDLTRCALEDWRNAT